MISTVVTESVTRVKVFKIRRQINVLQYSGIIVRDVTQRTFRQKEASSTSVSRQRLFLEC